MTGRDAEIGLHAQRGLADLRLCDVVAADATGDVLGALHARDWRMRAAAEHMQLVHERQIENLAEVLAGVGTSVVAYARRDGAGATASEKARRPLSTTTATFTSGARSALRQLRQSELALERAYLAAQALTGLSPSVVAVVDQGVEAQRRHVAWLTRALISLEGAQPDGPPERCARAVHPLMHLLHAFKA